MRLLQLVHGFPPEQNAGTETYAARLADGLRARGWEVLTLAAAPRPGEPMYAIRRSPGVVRVANNAPYAGLRRPSDPAMDRIVARELAAFRPDVVHVQHLQGLSTTLPVGRVVWTLHDAFAFCAAGGLLLRDGRACDGPGEACAACASGWARDNRFVTGAMAAAAKVPVSPDRLHHLWKRLPASLRDRVSRAPAPPLTAAQIRARSAALRAFARRCTLVAPSRWLAREAERHGLGPVTVVPHGVDPAPVPRTGDGPFLFLGTLAPHKGPHLVVEAARRAGVALDVVGPDGPDAAYAAALPRRGSLAATDVPAALARARALVLGSVWPENAPLVVLEARAQKCPVIAPDIGGLPEICDARYPPGDVDALATWMRAPPPSPAPPPSFAAHLDAILGVYKRTLERP
ncbi:MAG: glycosyltransferase [Myxococcota bacterium]